MHSKPQEGALSQKAAASLEGLNDLQSNSIKDADVFHCPLIYISERQMGTPLLTSGTRTEISLLPMNSNTNHFGVTYAGKSKNYKFCAHG